MKSILVILTVLASSQAFAVEADKWLGVDGNTEGRSADVDGCTTGNCPQKQYSTPWTYESGLAEVNSIMGDSGKDVTVPTSKATK